MSRRQGQVATAATVIAILFFGAIFGFFYAWVCSTMWGLDRVDPRAAIEAMNGMNASVRNPAFFLSFFVTPLVGAAAAILTWRVARRRAILLAVATVLHVLGVILVTQLFNLPLNEALAAAEIPQSSDEAARVWTEYSGPWQTYNLIRMISAGVSLALVAGALALRPRATRATAAATATA